MKSNKQRRREIREARAKRKLRQAASANWPACQMPPPGSLAVYRPSLATYNSYDEPLFVQRGWYQDLPFTCRDCGAEQIWTAAQQRWWYEVCKGQVFSTAVRCRACRLNKRIRDGRERPDADRAITQTRA
ncbi:zinc-ribbon domain-containing protein [Pseudomonas sp. PDM11]|uniref:zinc-ribbon domain-containing protein n=1 Tax=Pseudomonas sp. PDM11 TaxID=2769309 RepID=UPI00298D3120|nr:zinc-ribbon domain-containing protein [Pseudomonas sp. PDM11]